jgi:hypothetical protein
MVLATYLHNHQISSKIIQFVICRASSLDHLARPRRGVFGIACENGIIKLASLAVEDSSFKIDSDCLFDAARHYHIKRIELLLVNGLDLWTRFHGREQNWRTYSEEALGLAVARALISMVEYLLK